MLWYPSYKTEMVRKNQKWWFFLHNAHMLYPIADFFWTFWIDSPSITDWNKFYNWDNNYSATMNKLPTSMTSHQPYRLRSGTKVPQMYIDQFAQQNMNHQNTPCCRSFHSTRIMSNCDVKTADLIFCLVFKLRTFW